MYLKKYLRWLKNIFSSKNPEEAELEDTLNQVMVVFKYIEDKDVFQKFYSKMLAKRLVQHMSASDDAEASMISKLKVKFLNWKVVFHEIRRVRTNFCAHQRWVPLFELPL